MKKQRIQNIIMTPLFTILILGIVLQCLLISIVASRTARELSTNVVDETSSRYASDFDTMVAELCAVASTTGYALKNIGQDEDSREQALAIMADTLLASDMMTGIWTCWEPNAYDGRDTEFANTLNHDETGRFIPYVYKASDTTTGIMALPGYEIPGEGDYYLGAKNSQATYVTEPYETDMGDRWILVITITVPIMDNGRFVGAVGIDFSIENLASELNSASVLEDGYIFSMSSDGYFSSHPDENLEMENYENTWMKNYSAEIEGALQQGTSFLITAQTDDGEVIFSGEPVNFGNSAVRMMVGSIVPMSTVNQKSVTLITLIIIAGVVLLLAACVPTLIVLRRTLRELPAMSEAASQLAQGDVDAVKLPPVTSGATKNEITLLSRSFVELVQTTKEQVAAIQRIADGDYSFSFATLRHAVLCGVFSCFSFLIFLTVALIVPTAERK